MSHPLKLTLEFEKKIENKIEFYKSHWDGNIHIILN